MRFPCIVAEDRFKDWPNDSRLPFVGSVAFDVKAKSVYEGHFIFDVDDVARLLHFDEIFRITTFFACLGPEEPGRCWWFRLGKVAQIDFNQRRGILTIEVPLVHGLAVNMDEPLQQALRDVLLLM